MPTIKTKTVRSPLWSGPCDSGPQGGITFSLLSRFSSCRERFVSPSSRDCDPSMPSTIVWPLGTPGIPARKALAWRDPDGVVDLGISPGRLRYYIGGSKPASNILRLRSRSITGTTSQGDVPSVR
jgi:hypothetical protein